MLRTVLFVTISVLCLDRCAHTAASDFPAEAEATETDFRVERGAIEAIKAAVAKVEANLDRGDGRVSAVTLHGAKDGVFAHLRKFEHLRQLSILDSPCLNGLGFEHLSGLDDLDILVISNAGITDEGVCRIAHIENLRILTLAETRISSHALPALGRLGGLVSLDLSSNPHIQSGSFAPLAKLQKLEQLMLHGLDFRDSDLESLERMESLKILDLSDTKVGDEGLVSVELMGRNKQDFWLYLNGTCVTAEGGDRLEDRLPAAFIVHDGAATIRERVQREQGAGSNLGETQKRRQLVTRGVVRTPNVRCLRTRARVWKDLGKRQCGVKTNSPGSGRQ